MHLLLLITLIHSNQGHVDTITKIVPTQDLYTLTELAMQTHKTL